MRVSENIGKRGEAFSYLTRSLMRVSENIGKQGKQFLTSCAIIPNN